MPAWGSTNNESPSGVVDVVDVAGTDVVVLATDVLVDAVPVVRVVRRALLRAASVLAAVQPAATTATQSNSARDRGGPGLTDFFS